MCSEDAQKIYEKGMLMPTILWGKDVDVYQDEPWYREKNSEPFESEVILVSCKTA